MLTLRDLFQVVYELKKAEVEEAKHKIEDTENAAEAKEGDNADPVYSVRTPLTPGSKKASMCFFILILLCTCIRTNTTAVGLIDYLYYLIVIIKAQHNNKDT